MKQSARSGLRAVRNAQARHRTKTASDPVVTHARTPALFERPTSHGRTLPQAQSGVLAFRHGADGIEVLLVRKLRSGSWGIPKGKVKRGLSSAENAAKEAFEEAGISGLIEQRASGSYRALKRQIDQKILIEVAVHLLEVTETAAEWPEQHKRDIRWCPPQTAAKLLGEPLLAELCRELQSLNS